MSDEAPPPGSEGVKRPAPPAQRTRVDRRALLLGLFAGGTGALFVAFALSSGVGGGAAFPLMALWIVLLVLAVKLARRLRSVVTRRRGGA